MPPRKLLFAAPLALLVLLLVAACGGGDDDDSASVGQLSDPNNVPTATPWQDVPAVVLIDPNNIQPLPPDTNGRTSTPTPEPGAPGVCGQTYTVEAGDTVFGIADKCGVDSQRIIDLNPDIDPAALSIGDILIMPDVSAESDSGNTSTDATDVPVEEQTEAPTEEATEVPTEASQ